MRLFKFVTERKKKKETKQSTSKEETPTDTIHTLEQHFTEVVMIVIMNIVNYLIVH